MRILIVAALALSLGGCASLNPLKGVFDGLTVATTPVTITRQMVYDAENGLKAAAAGLVGYRRLCIQKVIDPVTRNCRKVIVSIQPYTRAAAIAIVELREAVAVNDQRTAIDAYRALRNLITNIQAERLKAGV